MTGDASALLRAVLEAPADDAPRLVYADWLDENGQPERAEFIRLQVAKAGETCVNHSPRQHTCADPGCPRCGPFKARTFALSQSPGFMDWLWDGWAAPVYDVRFDRGFVVMAVVEAEVFVGSAARLFALAPLAAIRLHGRLPALSNAGATWYRQGDLTRTVRTSAIPEPVFDLLRGGVRPWPVATRRGLARTYPTHTDANEALSEACVRFGRQAAGLT